MNETKSVMLVVGLVALVAIFGIIFNISFLNEDLAGQAIRTSLVRPATQKVIEKTNVVSDELILPSKFDWRTVHGENWLTPVRNQGETAACTAFGGLVPIEAAINLYFNQHLDIDLSEQMTISCGNEVYFTNSMDININPCTGINSPASTACDAVYYGIADEECYPQIMSVYEPDYFSCTNLCQDYSNRMWFTSNFTQLVNNEFFRSWTLDSENNVVYEGFLIDRLHQVNLTEDSLKEHIIKYGPVSASAVLPGHTAAIVGWEPTDFKQITQCDSAFCSEVSGCENSCEPGKVYCKNIYYSLSDHKAVKGAKLICDSQGQSFDYSQTEFCNDEEFCISQVCVNKNLVSVGNDLCVGDDFGEAGGTVSIYEYLPGKGEDEWIIKNSYGTLTGEDGYEYIKKSAEDFGVVGVVHGPVIPPLGVNLNILCEDKDGDGYCNWGISETKPATCPSTCKSQKDCDDSNRRLGPFISDTNLNCKRILIPIPNQIAEYSMK